jgi:hypothetical protein
LFFITAFSAPGQDSLTVDTIIEEGNEERDTNDNDSEADEYRFDQLRTPDSSVYFSYPIPDSAMQSLREDDAFWYANTAPEKKKETPGRVYKKPMYLQPWFRNLVWVVIVASFIGVIIWFLVASDVRLFRKKPKAVSAEADTPLADDLFSIDYDLELQKRISASDYRPGVRLMYLHILRLMADKEIIVYKMERTNSEYLKEVFRSPYYREFFSLTRNFEYVWYGNFDITEQVFNKIRQEYISLKNKLAS